MAKVKGAGPSESLPPMRPALSAEARENQLISLTMDRAEEQLREGTASSQVMAHFLKQSTVKAKLEIERLQRENELLRAKTEQLQSMKKSEDLLEEALKAFRSYSGQNRDDEDDEYDY